ncbi:MAG TPA: response regulator transcription factor [Thermoleophilaceae bacterium]
MERTRVLVADDDADVRGLLAAFVSSDPTFKLVGVAADADEAIALANEHKPDAALLDVSMPGGGGLRVVRELQAYSPQTSVVALSAYDERNIVIEMLQAGAMSYLVKGATREQILQSLHRSIEARSKLA